MDRGRRTAGARVSPPNSERCRLRLRIPRPHLLAPVPVSIPTPTLQLKTGYALGTRIGLALGILLRKGVCFVLGVILGVILGIPRGMPPPPLFRIALGQAGLQRGGGYTSASGSQSRDRCPHDQ